MTVHKLVKRLRRELLANPKKGGFLGLLMVVAVYFWGPLVWGWFVKSDATPVATAAGATPALAAAMPETPVQAQAMPTKPETATIPWQQLVTWMDNDPRTAAANLVMAERDPFGLPKEEPPPTEVAPEAETPVVEESITPQSLGLALSSTIIGAHRRVARINGKTYEEGQTCELSKDGKQVAFTLAEVHPRRVVLTRDGSSYELVIPIPAGSEGMELMRNAN